MKFESQSSFRPMTANAPRQVVPRKLSVAPLALTSANQTQGQPSKDFLGNRTAEFRNAKDHFKRMVVAKSQPEFEGVSAHLMRKSADKWRRNAPDTLFCGENKYADNSGHAMKMVDRVQKNLLVYQSQIADKKDQKS